MKGLSLMLKLTDLIKDDQLFCETENNVVYSYIGKKGLLDISPEEWDMISERGLCCEDIAGYHLETLAMSREEKHEMIERLLDETRAASLDRNGGITERLHWWNKGTTPGYIRQDIAWLFNLPRA